MLGETPETKLHFDIYEENARGEYTCCYHRDEQLPSQLFTKLKNHRDKPLFVSREDKVNFIDHIGRHAGSFGEGFSTEQAQNAQEVLLPLVDDAFEDLLSSLPSDLRETLRYTKPAIEASVLDVAQSGAGLSLMLRLFCCHDYLIRHSFLVAALAVVIGTENETLEKHVRKSMVMGALLHDMGMLRIDEELYIKPRLQAHEWEIMHLHPTVGEKVLDDCPHVPQLVREIIAGHHAQPNGRGYGYAANKYPLWVGALDAFATIVIPTPYRVTSMSPRDAWKNMHDDEGHFDDEALKQIKHLFVDYSLKKAG